MMAFDVTGVECLDLSKSKLPISTGVGFLDHMVDQFNSHAQVGVSICVGNTPSNDPNRFAHHDQSILLPLCGKELGQQMRNLLTEVKMGAQSRFCCPLDEALVECRLERADVGCLQTFSLAPYGGRQRIGRMETRHVEGFMRALAESAGLNLSLVKKRGHNGHHIVESSFKALSRALRNLVDTASPQPLWGPDSASWKESIELQRCAVVERQTKETNILVDLSLDGAQKGIAIDTGLPTLDEILKILAQEAQMSLTIRCKGDLWIDDHHTSEDVSIALGQVLTKALGSKAGLNRMWCSQATYGDAIVEVTMDLSNRPFLGHDLSIFGEEEYVEKRVGDDVWLSVEMLEHVFDSLVMNARMTAHFVEIQKGKCVKETAMATAMAFGRALGMCAAVDPRRAGKTASSKGTLSV